MLRTVVVLLILCLGGAVVGTAVTGQFWLTVVALAGALVLGATALSLVRMPDGEADVRPLPPPRRLPGSTVTGRGTGVVGRAA
jgi:hypothetical protein